MKETLCGKRKCPGLCQRVCHCPAGLERSRELLGMLRNRREMSRPRASLYSLFPPERWSRVEFVSQARAPLSRLRSRVMSQANWYHYHAGLTRSQALKLSWAEAKQVTLPVKHNFGALNQPEHGKPSRYLPTHNYHQDPLPYTRQLKSYASCTVLVALLLFIGIVVLLGLTINDGDFAPGYEPPQTYSQEWK